MASLVTAVANGDHGMLCSLSLQLAAGVPSAIPVSHFHAPPECMTIYREDSHSHTPYQESLETPDLLPCAHLSRYLDI